VEDISSSFGSLIEIYKRLGKFLRLFFLWGSSSEQGLIQFKEPSGA
jgi:hypothetical protein